MGIIWLACNFCPILEFKILNKTHCSKMWNGWMELDTSYWFVLTILLLIKYAGNLRSSAILSISCCFIITELFKIWIEDIDDLIWLKGLFNTLGYTINEFIKLLVNVLILIKWFLNLINKVTVLILAHGVNTSIIVCLGLEILFLIRCLETNLELQSFLCIWLSSDFIVNLQIMSTISLIFLCEWETVIMEITTRFGNSHADQWSKHTFKKRRLLYDLPSLFLELTLNSWFWTSQLLLQCCMDSCMA